MLQGVNVDVAAGQGLVTAGAGRASKEKPIQSFVQPRVKFCDVAGPALKKEEPFC